MKGKLNTDFWTFWTGQVISTLGTSFTGLAIPLLIYRLTHSAVDLGVSMAVAAVPYLLFGLVIGAWVDRLNRKALMISSDVLMAASVAAVPLVGMTGHLSLVLIYASVFVERTLFIVFNAGQFAALPSLVPKADIVGANGRLQASYSTSMVVGPLLAGALAAVVPVYSLLWVDAASFLVSAGTLLLIRRSFNTDAPPRTSSLRQDVTEGLRYVLGHPVLRSISLMMALANFVGATVGAEMVLFAKERFAVSNTELGILFAAEGAAAVFFSLAAGRLRRRWSFSLVALGALTLGGVSTVLMAVVPLYTLMVAFASLSAGFGTLFNIQTGSLRQQIVPNHMLGRVVTIAGVLAWSAIPLGSLLGGFLIQASHNVDQVYVGIGVLMILIPLAFAFTPLGRAGRYLQEVSREENDARTRPA